MPVHFKEGDLVWGKMKGYPPWPGMITKPNNQLKRQTPPPGSQCIYFFGSRNYGWVEECNLKPYFESKAELINLYRSTKFQSAVKEIEEFIIRQKVVPECNPFPDQQDQAEVEFDKLKEIEQSTASTKPQKKNVRPKTSKTPNKKIRLDEDLARSERESSPEGLNHTTKNYVEILNRPSVTEKMESSPVDMENISDTVRLRNIEPSSLTFGFIGLGIMGSGIVKNIIHSGHKVNLWCRTLEKAQEVKKQVEGNQQAGRVEVYSSRSDVVKNSDIIYSYDSENVTSKVAEEVKRQADVNNAGQVGVHPSPSDVVKHSDIIFCCVSDPRASKDIVYGNLGVIYGLDDTGLSGKGYVEMTLIDPETSKDISNVITSKGGRYLEAQMQGSKKEANDGNLIILGAGDRTLFDDCQSCFKAMGKTAFYLGNVGCATKMNLILQTINGVALAGLAEGFALADRCGLYPKDLLEIFELTNMSCPALVDKANIIINSDFGNSRIPLQHMQKDLRLSLKLGDSLQQPLLMTSTANEVFKHARRLGYDEHDAAAVYVRARY